MSAQADHSDVSDLSEVDNRSSVYPPSCVSASEHQLSNQSNDDPTDTSNDSSDSGYSTSYVPIRGTKPNQRWKYRRVKNINLRNRPVKPRRHWPKRYAGRYLSMLAKYSRWNINTNKKLRGYNIPYVWPRKPDNLILNKHQREIAGMIKHKCHSKMKSFILNKYRFKLIRVAIDSKECVKHPSYDKHFKQMYVSVYISHYYYYFR